MTPTADQLTVSICNEAANELDAASESIAHCLAQLNDEQVWWRPAASMNSIGNLLLHLCGNLRQWAVAGIGGAEDVRCRPDEFSERGPIPKDELMSRLRETVAEAKSAFSAVSASELLRPRRIQGFDVTGIEAIFSTVPHFRGHTQKIVHLTRLQIGDAYKFKFVPSTPEEGAPQP